MEHLRYLGHIIRIKSEYGDVGLPDECSQIRLLLIEPHGALSARRLPWRFQGDGNSVRNAIVAAAPASDTCRLIGVEK